MIVFALTFLDVHAMLASINVANATRTAAVIDLSSRMAPPSAGRSGLVRVPRGRRRTSDPRTEDEGKKPTGKNKIKNNNSTIPRTRHVCYYNILYYPDACTACTITICMCQRDILSSHMIRCASRTTRRCRSVLSVSDRSAFRYFVSFRETTGGGGGRFRRRRDNFRYSPAGKRTTTPCGHTAK